MSSTSTSPSGGMTGLPADYQRFSSPPVNNYGSQQGTSSPATGNGDYQRFSSPPVPSQAQQQPMGNLYPQQQQQGQPFRQQQQAGFSQQQHPNGSHAPWDQFGMMNDATAQMGVQFGRSAVQAGQDYMNRNVSSLPLYLSTRRPASDGLITPSGPSTSTSHTSPPLLQCLQFLRHQQTSSRSVSLAA